MTIVIDVSDNQHLVIDTTGDDDNYSIEGDAAGITGLEITFTGTGPTDPSELYQLEFRYIAEVTVTIADGQDMSWLAIAAYVTDSDGGVTDTFTVDIGSNASIGSIASSIAFAAPASPNDMLVTVGDNSTITSLWASGGITTVVAGDDLTIIGTNFLGPVIGVYGAESSEFNFTTGSGFSTPNMSGSDAGPDTIIFGDNATISGEIVLGQGDSTITAGNGFSATDILLGDDVDTIVIGNDARIDDIQTEDGNDSVVIGTGLEGNTVAGDFNIEMGGGDDTLTLMTDLGDGVGTNFYIDGDGGTDTLILEFADPSDMIAALGAAGWTDNGDGTWSIGTGDTHIALGDVDFYRWENFGFACFTLGTFITTKTGDVKIEDLKVGDLVKTLDDTYEAIRWIGSRTVKASDNMAPIMIKGGAIGNEKDILVSPQHRMLLTDWRAELFFGETEVLAPAKSLVNGDTVFVAEGGEVTYLHVMFDTHQVIFGNGFPSESFHPGEQALSGLEQEQQNEVFAIFPELKDDLANYGKLSRRCLKNYEVSVLQ